MNGGADERRSRATQDAAEWLLQMESAPLSDVERAWLAEWLLESPLHVAELLHASRLQRGLKNFAERGLIGPASVEELAVPPVVTPLILGRAELPRARSRLVTFIAAAATLAAVAITAIFALQPAGSLVIQTQLGERRELSLSDGSSVTVGPSSELRVSFGTHDRLAVLRRGEAFFRVAKDNARPFLVEAGGARTQDIGTAFSIEHRNDNIVVTVVEGEVSVRPLVNGGRFNFQGGGAAPAVMLARDEQVSVSSAGVATPVRKVDSQAEASWAQGRFIFDNARVGDIAQRFNQFNRIQIRIASDALAARLFTGVFRADDPRSFAELLVSEGVAHLEQSGNGDLVIDVASAAADSHSQH